MRKILFLLIVGLILFGGVNSVEAASSRRELVINSSRQEINYKNRIFIYEGEVKGSWRDLLFEGDRLEVYLTKEDALIRIIIKGAARILQMANDKMKKEATCELATYTAEDDVMIMENEAHYHDEMDNDILADKITVWIGGERLIAEGIPVKAIYSLKGEEEVGPASGESH